GFERNHALVHRARSARSALKSRRRDLQYAIAKIGTTQGGLQFRKILCRLVSTTVVAKWRQQDRQSPSRSAKACRLRRRREQETRAGFVSCDGAIRSQAGSTAIIALAFCRYRDRTVCHQRDLFLCAVAARAGQTGRRNPGARGLFLPVRAS